MYGLVFYCHCTMIHIIPLSQALGLGFNERLSIDTFCMSSVYFGVMLIPHLSRP